MNWLYLSLNAAVLSVPLLFSWHPRLRFRDEWRAFLPAVTLTAAGFLIWDAAFTALGVWGFDHRFILGPGIAGLPLEELLFFFTIPYSCVFTYHAFERLELRGFSPAVARSTAGFLTMGCAVLIAVFWGRLYTVSAALAAAALFLWLFHSRPRWSGRLLQCYLVLLVPFVATNGVLTGIRFWNYPVLNLEPEAVRDQVVWYASAENLGIRVLTIPVEDFLYAFALIGLNVALFHAFRDGTGSASQRIGPSTHRPTRSPSPQGRI